MKIQRYTMTGQYGAQIYIDDAERGEWVAYEDHLAAVEELEYEIRYLREQLAELEAEVCY